MTAYQRVEWPHRGQITCPECGEPVFVAANHIALDAEVMPREECTNFPMNVALFGTQLLAVYDDQARMAQNMHVHQPPEAG